MFPSSNSSQRVVSENLSLGNPKTSTSARRKISLAPGHSPLDWANLTSKTAKFQLRGVQPNTPPPQFVRVPKSELKKHASRLDCWTSLNGKVFNITPYIDFHPGGVDEIMKCAGGDGTALFNKYHSWVNPDRMLESCMVGILVS